MGDLIQCSNCGMHILHTEKKCGFCNSLLFLDKVRYTLKSHIPYFSLMMVVLFATELIVHMSDASIQKIHLFDTFVFCLFFTDIILDPHLHRLHLGKFFKHRALDIAFMIPVIKGLKIIEGMPSVVRMSKVLHVMHHAKVPAFDGAKFYQVARTAKYAKYAYPVVKVA